LCLLVDFRFLLNPQTTPPPPPPSYPCGPSQPIGLLHVYSSATLRPAQTVSEDGISWVLPTPFVLLNVNPFRFLSHLDPATVHNVPAVPSSP
jgi:hypothetical protein